MIITMMAGQRASSTARSQTPGTVTSAFVIYGIATSSGIAEVVDWLGSLGSNLEKNNVSLLNDIQKFSDSGRPKNDQVCHLIKKPIWQLKRGRLRILWFYGEEPKTVICSHGFMKDTGATPRTELARAQRAFDLYIQAWNNNKLEIREEL